MLDKPMMLAVIPILSSLGFAQARTQQEGADSAVTSKSTSCAYSYSSGPSASFTSYCLNGNDNIVQFFSPTGFEFINAGPFPRAMVSVISLPQLPSHTSTMPMRTAGTGDPQR
jgi:hypothetical protein